MTFFRLSILLPVALLLQNTIAGASPGLAAYTNASGTIVTGTVSPGTSYWNQAHTMIYTDYLLTVESVLKGTPPGAVTVTVQGGIVNDFQVVCDAAPALSVGNTGLYFMTGSGTRYTLLPGSSGFIALPANAAGPIHTGTYTFNDQAALKDSLALLAGSSWRVIQTAGNPRSPFTPTAPASVSGFTPTSITAGTGSVLEISGTGFGSTQGSGIVKFPNANAGGMIRNVTPYPSQYLLWTDTLIRVIVPSRSYTSNGVAGSGIFEVITAGGNSVLSASALQVTWALTNLVSNGIPVRPDLSQDNISGGYTFTMSDSLALNPMARQRFFSALERWRCATQLNFVPDYSSAMPVQLGFDGINMAGMDSLSPFIVANSVQYFSLCSGTWTLIEADIVFNSALNWNFTAGAPSATEFDFESSVMNALGHSALLESVVDTTDLMYAGASTGESLRLLNSNNLAAAAAVLNLSVLPNTCGPQPHQPVTVCATGAASDAGIEAIFNPYHGFCQGTFPVKTVLSNFGRDTLFTVQINWKLDGILQTPYTWSGSLLHNDTTAVQIGTRLFTPGVHTLETWTSLPNGNTDFYSDNDSTGYTFTIGTCTTANVDMVGMITPNSFSSCPGIQPVSVEFFNVTTSPLNYVIINWTVNGNPQPPFTWTGTIPGSQYSPVITIGTYNFTQPANTLKLWTSSPNGIPDLNPADDTIVRTYTLAGLSGTYTVGGTSPDYATVLDAVNALNTGGICGAVTFNIRPGVYTGNYTFYFPNVANHPIVFQAENSDSSTVILTSISTLFDLNGHSNITFRHLTMQTVSNNSAAVLMLSGNSDDITVESCYISMPVVNTTTIYGITMQQVAADSLHVFNTTFNGGSTGIALGTLITQPITYGLEVSGCTFRQQYSQAIKLMRQGGFRLINNDVYYPSGTAIGFLIESSPGNFILSRNKLVTYDNHCISLFLIDPQPTASTLIMNNFISLLRTGSTPAAFKIMYADRVRIYNNSIRSGSKENVLIILTGPNTPSHFSFINNIVVNMGSDTLADLMQIIAPTDNVFDTIDYNVYSTNSNRFGLPGNIALTLSDWQSYSRDEMHSVMYSSAFTSPQNLHVVPYPADSVLAGRGFPISMITTDIDGQPRDPLAPDIGADEFSLQTVDAALCSLLPQQRACTGSNPVSVSLYNYGAVPLTSAVIGWKVNSVLQPPYNWSGNLAPGNLAGALQVGNYTFSASTSYTITVWVEQPNGITDPVALNDTITSVVQGGGLSGIYTIGGVGPNYTNFTAAKNALVANGVCGPVIFDVRPGTYQEIIVFPAIAGASAINTITFRAENGDSSSVILTNGISYPTIALVGGAHHYTFSRLAVMNQLGPAIYLNGCHHNRVTHALVVGSVESAPVSEDTYFEIDHCRASTIKLLGLGPLVGTRVLELNNSIHDNYLPNGYIYMYRQRNPRIYNNRLDQAAIGTIMMSVEDVRDSVYISGNQLKNTQNLTASPEMYVYVTLAPPGTRVQISNNMILSTLGGTTMDIISKPPVDMIHNTISTRDSYGIELNLEDDTSRFMNNCIYNYYAGYAFRWFHMPATSAVLESDYNNLYSTGPYIANVPQAGNIINIPQLVALTGTNTHSVEYVPQFVSATDLHLNNDFHLWDKGITVAGITADIDQQLRDSLPDIGADEIAGTLLQPNDGSITAVLPGNTPCGGLNSIQAQIRNMGSNTLSSLVINWTVNGILQPAVLWNGSLAPLAYASPVTLGSVNLLPNTTYTIEAWSAQPNNAADAVPANDTIALQNILPRLNGTYTVGGINPDFSNLSSTLQALGQNGICGPVIFDIRNGTDLSWVPLTAPVTGSSAVNTITFRSENNDSSLVLIGGADLRFMQYVSFIRLRFINSLQAGQMASHITFANCLFDTGIQSAGNRNDYFTVTNSHINATCSLYGDTLQYEYGTVFSNNRFTACASLLLRRQHHPAVTGNSFECIPSSSSANEAIQLKQGLDSCVINQNMIYGNYSGGIFADSLAGSIAPLLITNNMISGTGNMLTGIGIQRSYTPARIYHNNLLLSSSSGSSAGMRFNGSVAGVFNTISMHQGAGYALLKDSSSILTGADNNDYFVNGSTIALWNSSPVNTLSALQAVSGQESGSLQVDPLYVSAADLHIQNQQLNAMGTFMPLAGNDFDNDIRQNPPDIGADERNFFALDIGISSITQPVPVCEGLNVLTVNLENYGIQQITAAVIQWTMNGVPQPPFNWSGTLAPGLTTPVTIGTYTFVHNTPVQCIVWSEQPNNTADNYAGNDTLQAQTLFPRLNGTYTVGGSSPDYADFSAAVTALHLYGVCGPVIFNVRNGIYTEQLQFGSVPGSGPANTITFQSELNDSSLVELSWSATLSDNYVIKLDNTGDLIFRKITFRALNQGAGTIIDASGSIQRVAFRNNRFSGNTGPNLVPYDNVLLQAVTATPSENLVAENNLFEGGGVGVYSIGSGPFIADTILQLRNNRFFNQQHRAIRFEQQSLTQLTGNTINTANAGISYAAVEAGNGNSIRIQNNNIADVPGNGLIARGLASSAVYNNFMSIRQHPQSILPNHAAYFSGVTGSTIYSNSFYTTGDRAGAAAAVCNGTPAPCQQDTLVNNIFAVNGAGAHAFVYEAQSMSLPIAGNYNGYFSCGDTLIYALPVQQQPVAYTSLLQWQNSMNRDLNSVFAPPAFTAPGNLHIISNSFLDGKGTPLAQIPADIDGQPRNSSTPDIGADEFNSITNDAGIITASGTTIVCNGNNAAVTIGNYGTNPLTAVTVGWSINSVPQANVNWTGNLAPASVSSPFSLGLTSIQQGDVLEAWTIAPNNLADNNTSNDSSCCGNVSTPVLPDLGNDTAFCNGTTFLLTPGTYNSYTWSDNSTSGSLAVTGAGTYWVTVTDAGGCIYTDSIVLSVLPGPATPTVTLIGTVLQSSAISGNQWYLNSAIIPGATAQQYQPAQSGNYTVAVTDTNGCTTVSAVYAYVVGFAENAFTGTTGVFPNPNNGEFTVLLPGKTGGEHIRVTITDAAGRLVWETDFVPDQQQDAVYIKTSLAPGAYLLGIRSGTINSNQPLLIRN